MLKVLYLLNHAGKAGTERYVESLVSKLGGDKVKAYFAYNEEGLLVERMKAAGVETYKLTMRHPFDFKAAWDLNRLCRKLGIDIVHTQYLRENYIALWSRLFNPGVKVMYTNHFILRNNFVLRCFNRILTPLQANVIAVCNKGKEMLISNGVDGSKIHVIFNGVDPELWGKREASTLRQELGIDEETLVLLCVSRFAYDKGHRFLVRSIAELKKLTTEKFKCILAGDGPLQDEIKQLVKELGLSEDVIFVGFRKDIKNLYDGSDIYINSSQHEALSFAMLEVLASGLPLVATDMGGNRDIVNEETNCGILVKYDDARDMAEALNKVMSSRELQIALRENALKAAREKFNLDNKVVETYNLYMESCGNSIAEGGK